MQLATAISEASKQPSTFASAILNRSENEIHSDVLDHDGNTVLVDPNRSHSGQSIVNALHTAVTENGVDVVFITPTKDGAEGTMLMLDDELQRSVIDTELWGIMHETKTSIEFEQGSTIEAIHDEYRNSVDRLRGRNPDLLILDNWHSDGKRIDDRVINEVVQPLITTGTDVWVNDTEITDESLYVSLFDQGAFVQSAGKPT
jgi:hypothetical protein